jgi:hypothetical protein
VSNQVENCFCFLHTIEQTTSELLISFRERSRSSARLPLPLLPPHLGRKNHFLRSEEQNFAKHSYHFLRSVFSFHCVRGRRIQSDWFWTRSLPARLSTAVHGPFTPAVLSVLLPLLLSDHGICRAGQDTHMNQVVAYCCFVFRAWKSCFVFRAWMSIIILNRPVFYLCFRNEQQRPRIFQSKVSI